MKNTIHREKNIEKTGPTLSYVIAININIKHTQVDMSYAFSNKLYTQKKATHFYALRDHEIFAKSIQTKGNHLSPCIYVLVCSKKKEKRINIFHKGVQRKQGEVAISILTVCIHRYLITPFTAVECHGEITPMAILDGLGIMRKPFNNQPMSTQSNVLTPKLTK